MPFGEQVSASAGEHDGGSLHDNAGDLNRVAVAIDGGTWPAASGGRPSRWIELHLAGHVRDAAGTGTDAVIVAVVLDTLDCRDGGVHSRRPARSAAIAAAKPTLALALASTTGTVARTLSQERTGLEWPQLPGYFVEAAYNLVRLAKLVPASSAS